MSKNSILDDLEYDENSGTLTYHGVRYLLVRPETIIDFQKEIEKVLGKNAKEGFYQGGFSGGYLSSKKYKETFNYSDKQLIDFMMKMGTEIGWGKFTLNHFDPEKGILGVSVKNSPFAGSYGKSSKCVCDLIRGVVGGMASIIFDQYCIAHEVECVSKGFKKCVFIVDLKLRPFDILSGKKILVVDDESDILDSIKEILDKCVVETAGDFEAASILLQKGEYDAAVLDIMGVNGYKLLEITRSKKIPTLMLTAHALDSENFIKTIKNGARAYVPKEKLFEIKTFLTDVLTNHQGGVYKNSKWFVRLEAYFNSRFGSNWKENTDPEFWKKNFYN